MHVTLNRVALAPKGILVCQLPVVALLGEGVSLVSTHAHKLPAPVLFAQFTKNLQETIYKNEHHRETDYGHRKSAVIQQYLLQ